MLLHSRTLYACIFFFFNDTATTEIYTLSLHDALPIFQGTHGVRDALDRIRLPMCIVVHRVNTPLTTGTMMVHVENSIHDSIAEIKVRRTHIDLRPQRSRTIWKLSLFHALEQIEILFDRTAAIGAFPHRFS